MLFRKMLPERHIIKSVICLMYGYMEKAFPKSS